MKNNLKHFVGNINPTIFTTMNELQQLETKIRQALPRLQEKAKNTIFDWYRHEIYLSDVLEWLGALYSEVLAINIYGGFYSNNGTYPSKWDLSNPLLKDQPKEVIAYLNNLK